MVVVDGICWGHILIAVVGVPACALATALAPEQGTPFSRREVVAFTPPTFHIEEPEDSPAAEGLTAEGMQRLVDRIDGARAILEQWIRRSMTPGLHYGIIPLDGQPPSKPTLLKPGAELVALLYGWKFHFVADLDSLQMYGPAAGGTFAYICYLIDGQGRTVGQGRGMAELR